MHRKLRALIAVVMACAGSQAFAVDAEVPAVHARQIAFGSQDVKHVIVTTSSTAPLHWTLTDSAGRDLLDGSAKPFGPDVASGETVQQIDLSALTQAGRYTLTVAGAEPRVVTIAAAPLAPLKYAALNYFYQTRAGIAIEARYAGGKQWARPAGHAHEVATCFSGKDEQGNVWPGCDYSLDVTGGWYDAGDQGKYVVNGGIALWTLQNLYEQQRQWGDAAFADGKAALPESGNGIDDLLDEARFEMRFLMAMQVPDGKRAMVPVGPQPRGSALRLTEIDASGTAHHKVSDRNWTRLPTAPADDREERLLYPPSTAATLNLAATAAQCARIWRTIDPPFAQQCLHAAERAFAAALRNPAVYAPSTFTGSGGYGDTQLADEFYWATAELYVTTGRPAFADALRKMDAFRAPLSEPSWANVAALGTISLATQPNGLTPTEIAAARARIVAAADGFLAEETKSGYRIPHASAAFSWGSNSGLLNRAMILGLAERITGDRKYRDGTVEVVDYLLGRNPLDQSFVTGFGTRPLLNPHHRFWAKALDARYPGPPPGVLSGGPNSTAMTDEVARAMKGHCIGMRCWRDANAAFTMNEVAINWNAPLVWVTAYLDASAPTSR
jgi:endoglucanase